MIKITKGSYLHFPDCIYLESSLIKLVCTLDVGPRIIHFSFAGAENLFKVFNEKGNNKQWKCYGGHRLWVAPESKDITYQPDNSPVNYKLLKNGIVLIADTDKNGLQKKMTIIIHPQKAAVQVVHEIFNKGSKSIQVAPWALTVFKENTTVFLPLPPKGKHPGHLLPNGGIALWPYTDLSDNRFIFDAEFIGLTQNKKPIHPQKIGLNTSHGYGVAINKDIVFIKKYKYEASAVYPDNNSNFEIFTNKDMIELESLAPLVKLNPGKSAQHIENWSLFQTHEILKWNTRKRK